MSWSPIFDGIVDSSIWRESDNVLRVFLALLAKKRADHTVYATAYQIGNWAFPGRPAAEADALEALNVLSSPDTKRIEPQPFEGRRIQRTADGSGWLVLNGQKYEDMVSQQRRRDYQAKKQREYRARDKGKVSASYLAREERFCRAVEAGDQAAADAIAAEGLPDAPPLPAAG